jgi:hypothetical protein
MASSINGSSTTVGAIPGLQVFIKGVLYTLDLLFEICKKLQFFILIVCGKATVEGCKWLRSLVLSFVGAAFFTERIHAICTQCKPYVPSFVAKLFMICIESFPLSSIEWVSKLTVIPIGSSGMPCHKFSILRI